MNVDWARVLGIAGILATGAAAALLWKDTSPSNRRHDAWTPWIGLPATGMDASSPVIRELLLRVSTITKNGKRTSDPETSFASACGVGARVDFSGDPSNEYQEETYVVLMSQGLLMTNPQAWRITLAVDGNNVRATVQDARGLVFAPPMSRPGMDSVPSNDPRDNQSPRQLTLTKAQLQPVADAWRNPHLWDAPQGDLECSDGATLVLEACVGGRYAARSLRCAKGIEASQASTELQNALLRTLPLERANDPSSDNK